MSVDKPQRTQRHAQRNTVLDLRVLCANLGVLCGKIFEARNNLTGYEEAVSG